MKQYQFKIQWLLNYTNFVKMMEVLCFSILDKIVIRDSNLNIVETFKVKYRGSQAGLMEYIKEKYGDNFYVEVMKK